MTEHELRLAKALGACSFLPASSQKRFARDMAATAYHKPETELSLRQRHYMEIMAWRYRRQLPRDLVPLRKPLNLPCPTHIPTPRQAAKLEAERAKRESEPDMFSGPRQDGL